MSDIMCPFYRTECLRIDCAAFRIRHYIISHGTEYECKVDLTPEQLAEDGVISAPFCNALNKELPKKKLRIEKTSPGFAKSDEELLRRLENLEQ